MIFLRKLEQHTMKCWLLGEEVNYWIVLDEQTTDLKTIEDLKNKIMQDSIFKPMVNHCINSGRILVGSKASIGIPIAILGIVNAKDSEIDLNNQQAINKLKLTNSD
jgi:hypothetical protein